MVQGGGRVEWLISLGLQNYGTLGNFSTMYGTRYTQLYNGNHKIYIRVFLWGFHKGTYTKGQLYNTRSMDITLSLSFPSSFKTFKRGVWNKMKTSISKLLKKNIANRNPRAGMHHPCEDNLSKWQWYPLVKGEIIIENLSKNSLKVKGVVDCLLVWF